MADLITDQRMANFSKRIGRDIKDDRVRITGNEINISKLNETVGIHNKRLDNLTAAAQGKNFNFVSDADSAHSKMVPAGAMPYAGVKSFGGKTLVWNNIFTISSTNTSVPVGDADIGFTDNRDGTYTFNLVEGSKTGNRYFNNYTSLKEYPQNHKILFMVDKDVSSYLTPYMFLILTYPIDNSAVTVHSRSTRGYICSFTKPFGYFGMSGIASKTAKITVRPMVFDLTLMFGAGNEPSSVEEFEAMFPEDYYPYDAGTLNVVDSLPIPPAVQSLPGYGWSAGTAKNWIDWENKVYHREVASVDLGTLNWYRNNNSPEGTNFYSWKVTGKASASSITGGPIKIITSMNYSTPFYAASPSTDRLADKTIAEWCTNTEVVVRYDSISTAEELKSVLSGVMLYYELATPELIDISDILPDDNLIETEVGGHITFKNQHGDDYHISVPSEVEYMINVEEAL